MEMELGTIVDSMYYSSHLLNGVIQQMNLQAKGRRPWILLFFTWM